jgi:hypothetical protein
MYRDAPDNNAFVQKWSIGKSKGKEVEKPEDFIQIILKSAVCFIRFLIKQQAFH